MISRALMYGLLLTAGAQWADPAWAQRTYTCRQANGSVTVSDRPCGDSAPGYVYIGPTPGQQQSSSSSRSTSQSRPADVPEHQQYMSGRCAAMNDELRNGYSKGLSSETMSDLRRNYNRECAEDERKAYWQLRGAERANRMAELEGQRQQYQQQQQSALKQQQCDESKRIYHTKSARPNLTDAERAELARFKENYEARCM